MKALRYLALTALLAVVAFLGTLRVAVWLDYWERRNRPVDPHLTSHKYRFDGHDGIIWRKVDPLTWGSYRTPPRAAP